MTPELAEVCGIHAGDGYLRGPDKRRELDISGSIEEQEYYNNHVVPLFEKAFDLKINAKFFPGRNTYGFVIRNKEAITKMHDFGFPYGAKSTIVSAPKKVLNSKNKEVKCMFLRGLFDTDGCLHFLKRNYGKYGIFKSTREYYPRIAIRIVSKKLFQDICTLLTNLGFNYYSNNYQPKSPNFNYCYGIYLSGTGNLEKWIQNIGFKNSCKLSRYSVWKEHGFCPANLSFEQRKQILNKQIDPNSFY